MARNFEILPGGRVKRFRNRQTRCNCAKRQKGRPCTGYGVCHAFAKSRPRAARRIAHLIEREILCAARADLALLDTFAVA